MTSTLPASFFLYIRSRHSSKDPFSGYILCDAVQAATGGVTTTQITPRAGNLWGEYWTVQCPENSHTASMYRGMVTVVPVGSASSMNREFRTTTLWAPTGGHVPLTVTDPSGNAYPVLEVSKHTGIFGTAVFLKRNVRMRWAQGPVSAAAAANTIAHVPADPMPATPKPTPAPVPKKKPLPPPAPAHGDLQPYVAKQLMELAQLKKETCPIVMEEFSAGNTAVMPCGHLFMQLAIEESFKKEPNKCPWCRQAGRPTYV